MVTTDLIFGCLTHQTDSRDRHHEPDPVAPKGQTSRSSAAGAHLEAWPWSASGKLAMTVSLASR
jgi:hypothetical protein